MKSPVTKILLIANICIFIYTEPYLRMNIPGYFGESFFNNFGLLRSEFLKGAFWQPVTALFLHGSFLHLGVNMIALWSVGTIIEYTIGSKFYTLLYLFSGLFSSITVLLFQQNALTIGASGAILGLVGALAILFPTSKLLLLFIPLKAKTAGLVIVLLSLLFAIIDNSTNISHFGHLGGIAGGYLFTFLLLKVKGPVESLGKFYNLYTSYEEKKEIIKPKKVLPEFYTEEGLYYIRKPKVLYYDPKTGKYNSSN